MSAAPSEHDVRLALDTLGSWFEAQPTGAISADKYREVADAMARLRTQAGLEMSHAGGHGAGNVGLPDGVPVMTDDEEDLGLDLGFDVDLDLGE